MSEPIIKYGMVVPVSTEVLDDILGRGREFTPEEMAHFEAKAVVRHANRVRLAEALATAPEPLAFVAALHAPMPQYHDTLPPICEGCDFGGYEAEPPDWPCTTAILIGELLGVPDEPTWD